MLLVLAALLAAAGAGEPLVRVLARDGDGFGEAARVSRERPWDVPIPLLSRSEIVQRATAGAGGLALLIEGLDDPAAVSVVAVAHASGEQVLIAAGEPILVGPPLLPVSARAGERDVLAELARQDGVGPGAGPLRVELPADRGGRDVVLLGSALAPGAVLSLTGAEPLAAPLDARTALVLRPSGTVLDLAPADDLFLDQLFLARVQGTAELERVPLTVRGVERRAGGLELRLELPPEAPHAWTLLVRLDLARARTAAPIPASAPAPEGFLVDRAARAGVAMSHLEGPDEQLDLRPTMGPGAAFGDVDGDGYQDLYLVQGSGRPESQRPRNRLFRNERGARFTDVTATVGGGHGGAGMGALFFDGDGDADLDLYVANHGADVLFENRRAGGEPRLADVSTSAGVGGDLWSAGVAASDYDRDGDLDLYVTSYLCYDPALMPPVEDLPYRREDPLEMLPYAFPGQRNTFLRNDGAADGMRFTDVTAELGLLDEAGRGMQCVFWDFDRDGDDDLYVANDVSYNVLWRNEGGGTFKDVSFPTGMDDPRGSMGVTIGDVDLDGDEDLFLTNWQLEANALYVNNLLSHTSAKHHVATFRDAIVAAGLGPAGIGVTSWGAELFDAENDGDLDLFYANGYTSPDYESTGICVGQPDHFFENDGTGRFVDASAKAGAALARPLPSRAVVGCDFDQDGDVDLCVTSNNGPVQLLCNELPAAAKGRWLLVRLRGRGGNTHAIGAEVSLRCGGRLLRRSLRAGTSYLGGNPPELSFGLGSAQAVDELVVRWPSGRTSSHAVPALDRVVTLSEPE
jgi:enediyne biosynthesis protein E4